MAAIQRRTHDIHYEVLGDEGKPALLLIMGMAFSSRAWARLPDLLKGRFRVILFDNRGTGRSTRPPGLFSIGEMADDAVAVLDAVGVDRAYVFGISMGGMIALELALRHPERVQALALGCTYAGWMRSHKPSLRTLWSFFLENVRSRASNQHRVARFLVSAQHLSKDAEGFARWLTNGQHAGTATVLRQMFAATFHTTERRLRHIEAPTLVLTGSADLLIPPENSRKLAKNIPGARLVEFPGAGHCFPVEREDETFQALSEFFSATTPQHPL